MKWLLHGLPDGPRGFMDRVPDLSYGAAGAESSNGFEAFRGDVELLDWMIRLKPTNGFSESCEPPKKVTQLTPASKHERRLAAQRHRN